MATNMNLISNGQEDNSTPKRPTFGERLAFLAVIITALGDVLAVVSSAVLIEEGIQDEQESNQEKKEQQELLTKMQNQIAAMEQEIKDLKKGR
jgi:cell division protein FtsB